MADRVDGQCNHIQLLRLVRYSVEAPIVFGEWKCRECNEVLALALPAETPQDEASLRITEAQVQESMNWASDQCEQAEDTYLPILTERINCHLEAVNILSGASATPPPSEFAGMLKCAPRVGYWVAPCWNPKGEKVDCPTNTTGTMIIPDSGIGKPQAHAPEAKKFNDSRLDLNLDGVNILLDCADLKGGDEMSVGMVRSNLCKERIDAWRKREEKMDGPAHPLKLGKRKPAPPDSICGFKGYPNCAEGSAPQQGGCTPEMGQGCAFIGNSSALNQVNIEYKWCEQIRNNC